MTEIIQKNEIGDMDIISSLPINIHDILKIEQDNDWLKISTRSMFGVSNRYKRKISATTVQHFSGLIKNIDNILLFERILRETYGDIEIQYGIDGCYVTHGILKSPETDVRFEINPISDEKFNVVIKCGTQTDYTFININKNESGQYPTVMTFLLRTLPKVNERDYSEIIMSYEEVYDNTLQTVLDNFEANDVFNMYCYVYMKRFRGVYLDMIHIVVGGTCDVILTSPRTDTLMVDIYDRDTGVRRRRSKIFKKIRKNPMIDIHNYIITSSTNLWLLRASCLKKQDSEDIIRKIFGLSIDDEIVTKSNFIHCKSLRKYGVEYVTVKGYTLTQHETQLNHRRLINDMNMVLHIITNDPDKTYAIGFEYFKEPNRYFAFEFGDRSDTKLTDAHIEKIKRRVVDVLNKDADARRKFGK